MFHVHRKRGESSILKNIVNCSLFCLVQKCLRVENDKRVFLARYVSQYELCGLIHFKSGGNQSVL